MLRRAKHNIDKKPSKGFSIKKTFSLLRRKIYFNFEFRWGNQK